MSVGQIQQQCQCHILLLMLTISVGPYEISKVTFFHLIFYPSWLKENQIDERVLLTLSTSPLPSQNGKDIAATNDQNDEKTEVWC
jgi:hypothetical protein